MKIVYTASIDHLRAFARFNTRRRFPGYRALLKIQRLPIVRLATATVFASPVLMIVGGVNVLMHRRIGGLFPVAMGTLYVVMIAWFLLPPVRRQRQEQKWAKLPNLGKPITVEVDESGFHFAEPTIERHVDWNAVVEAEESTTHFFVVDSQPLVYIVPKEAFASASDADAFSKFVKSHLATRSP